MILDATVQLFTNSDHVFCNHPPTTVQLQHKKKKKDLITDKTLLLFHKEHLQQMLRDKQKQNNCRLEDTESKKN